MLTSALGVPGSLPASCTARKKRVSASWASLVSAQRQQAARPTCVLSVSGSTRSSRAASRAGRRPMRSSSVRRSRHSLRSRRHAARRAYRSRPPDLRPAASSPRREAPRKNFGRDVHSWSLIMTAPSEDEKLLFQRHEDSEATQVAELLAEEIASRHGPRDETPLSIQTRDADGAL